MTAKVLPPPLLSSIQRAVVRAYYSATSTPGAGAGESDDVQGQ